MRCAQCGTTNEAKARFCIECGNRLVAACASCGSQNPPSAKFCAECGVSLAAVEPTPPTSGERPVTRAERRLVSVLFADLVGFTPFSEERDAEEVRETLTSYFELSREVIERYGGSVEKFIGDAVMAVWGTPVAREDDAERAVRAAVELIDAVRGMDGELAARVGVQTGEAAVTLGATGQGMVAGDLVNTTARVQSVADPGTVLVDEATMRSSSEAIAFEATGEHELKGKSVAVPLWRALRVIAERGGRGRSDALEAPFVGRDTEFRLLKELFHASSRERSVRMISIVGQGGIGKSRLGWELEKYLDGLVETVWFHHGRSPSYGSGITFWALGEMVRGRCGLAESDDEATTRARVAETVAAFVPEAADRAWIESALLMLLGVGDASTPAEQLFPAWRSFFEHIAHQGTTLLVFEDLQWADPGLLAFIDHVQGWSHDLPICMVTLTRPELLDARPDWGTGPGATSISLGPMDRGSMQALLEGLVPGLPAATRDHIVDRADGVPLYAVETVRMLVNDGRLVFEADAYRPTGDLAALEAPETLRALVASRLDALATDDRDLLQSAAILGHTFSIEALATMTDTTVADLEPRLRLLVRREMLVLQADPRSPERGQYAFSQELLREVAYDTLARDERRGRHLAAARYFESLDADELAGALAAQYQAAHRNARPGPEADALAVQAKLALRGAAARALSLGSTEQAYRLYESALELAGDPADEADLLTLVARAAVPAAHEGRGREALGRAIELYRELDRRSDMARAYAALVDATLHDGWQLEAARSVARDAVQELEDLGVDRGLAELLGQLARIEMLVQEDFSVAIAMADRALAMAERLDMPALVADVLVTRGTALSSSGRGLEGLGAIEAGRRLAQAEGLPYVEGRALLNMSGPLAERDPKAMMEASRRALELARQIGDRHGISMATNNMAESARFTGDWDEAIGELRRELEASSGEEQQWIRNALVPMLASRGEDTREVVEALLGYVRTQAATGEPAWQKAEDAILGALDLPAGRYGDAARRLRLAAEVDPFNAALGYADVAFAALLDRDPVAAAAALEGMESTGSHGAMVKLAKRRTVAGIAALEGRLEEASAGFEAVMADDRGMGLPFAVATTGLLMVSLLDWSAPGVPAAAEEARGIFERLGARAWLDRLDEALARARRPSEVAAT
ncbi:MAG: adenylate/guanylate cyclase domain-containing protein [Candidatus Limnocylindrales bacterium]